MTEYRPGQRVALVFTDDPYTRLRPGDTGTVRRHDGQRHTVAIAWDDGSTLSMCLDAGDRITPLPPLADRARRTRRPARPHPRRPAGDGTAAGST